MHLFKGLPLERILKLSMIPVTLVGSFLILDVMVSIAMSQVNHQVEVRDCNYRGIGSKRFMCARALVITMHHADQCCY